MKNYITIAALLVAGTAFANAATTESEKLAQDLTALLGTLNDTTITMVGNNTSSNAYGVDTNGKGFLNSGRAGFSSIKQGETALTSISATDYSWAISFSLGTTQVADKMLFSTIGASNGDGYAIGIKSIDTTTGAYTFAVKSGNDAWASKTEVATLSGTNSSLITFAWDAVTYTLYCSTGSETKKISNPNAAHLSLSTTTAGTGTNAIGSEAPAGTIFWANGTNNPSKNISLKIAAIPVPEPSAFGLLAGIGALALVASRRRRK